MEWRNWGHRCSTGFFSSAYLQAWWITTNQTYRKRKLSVKTVIIVQFSFLLQHSLAFTRLVADSRFPASVLCLTRFWLLHNSLSLSLHLPLHPSPYFCAFLSLRNHDLRTRGWRMGGKADKLLVCSGLRYCSFLPLFLVLARAWCGWTVPGMARTVVADAVHMSSLHDYDME